MRRLLLLSVLIFSFASRAQVWSWAKAGVSASTTYDEGYSVCNDNAGNVFITGAHNTTSLAFGTYTLSNSGGYDIYLVKYDPNGNVLWAKSFGGANDDFGVSVNADISGNVYVTGYFESPSVTFGSTTLNNPFAETLFTVKCDPNGNVLWAKNAVSSNADLGNTVSSDLSGNILVGGEYLGLTETFGTYTLTSISPGTGMFLTKYNTSGNVLWAKCAKDTGGGVVPTGIATDASNNVYVSGFNSGINLFFNTYTLSSPSWGNAFLAKYDANGNELWGRISTGVGFSNDRAMGVTVDPSGNAYITGYFNSPTIVFGTFTLTNTGTQSIFVVKYDPSGNVVWAKTTNSTGYDYNYSICSDANNVYTAGSFTNTVNYGTFTLTPPVNSPDPMAIVRYDFNGNATYATYLTSGGDDQNAISVDKFCNVFVSGDYLSFPIPLIVGTTTLASQAYESIFVAKLSFNCPVGVEQLSKNDENISVYPNPTDHFLNISGRENDFQNSEIEITNTLGQTILKLPYSNAIDVSRLSQGFYNLKISSKNAQVYYSKFVKE